MEGGRWRCTHLGDDVHQDITVLDELRQTHRTARRLAREELIDYKAEALGGLIGRAIAAKPGQPDPS